MGGIHLDVNQIPQFLRLAFAYTGRQFTAEVCESVTIPIDAGLWSGGTRERFAAFNLMTGESMALPGQDKAPDETRRAYTAPLQPGLVIVRHSHFCGKDHGLTFFVHPTNAAAMLPAPIAGDLSETEKHVLGLTSSLKAAFRREYAERRGVDAAAYDAALAALQTRGLMTASKALTTAGKNAAASIGREYGQ